jgi:hypothetical protein
MEYVKVMYASTRSVNIDGAPSGATNDVLEMGAGTHQFDLGIPADYYPPTQNLLITGTSIFQPKIVVFTQKKS